MNVRVDIPRGVTAITTSGLRIPCDVMYYGIEAGHPRYRIIAEINWRTIQIVRVEIEHWPDGTMLVLDIGDATPGELAEYSNNIEWADLTR